MRSKIKENYLVLLSWLLLLFSMLCMYSTFDENHFELFINSDTVGLPNLYRDIVYDYGDLKYWSWASAPNLFPDAVLFYLTSFFVRENIVTVSYVYALIQLLLMTGMLVFIYKKIVPEKFRKTHWLIPVFFSLYFIEAYYFSHDASFGFYILTYSYHAGPFINCLIALCFYFSALKFAFKLSILTLIVFIGSFSDKLFIVMLIAPLVLTLLVNQVWKWKAILKTFLLLTGFGIACYLGLYLYEWIGEEKLIVFMAPHKIYNFGEMEPSALLFIEQMTNYILIPGFRSIQIVFTFLSIFAGIYYFFKYRKSTDNHLAFFGAFYVFFCVGTFLAPIINGNYTGYDTLRYNVYPFYFSSLMFAILITAGLVNKPIKGTIKTISLFAMAVLFVMVIAKFKGNGLKTYFDYYPETVAEIDSVAKVHHFTKGLSEYWTAKRTTMLSKEKVKILSVYNDVSMKELGSNISWYYSGDFDFVVADGLKPESVSKHFTVKDTIKTKHYTILAVEKYFFPQGKYFPENVNKIDTNVVK